MSGHEPSGHGHQHDIGEDYNIASLVNTAVIGCLLILVTVLWLRAMFARADRWEWERKVVTASYSERMAIEDASKVKISSYDWTDPAHNKVSIPLAEARAKVLFDMLVRQQTAKVAGSELLQRREADTVAPAEPLPGEQAVQEPAGQATAPTDGHSSATGQAEH